MYSSSNRRNQYILHFFRLASNSFALFLLLLPISGFSQEHHRKTDTSVAEKIYLQLSSSEFATDQTIWFKAIVTDTKNHLPSEISSVLYIDLIDFNTKVVEHKLIKLSRGIGHGHFDMQEDYEPGRYQIRAYTQWNLNFGEDFIFKTYINLYDTSNDSDNAAFGDLAIIEKDQGKLFLTGNQQPQGIGKETEKQIQVYLDWGKGRDTISVKRKGRDSYPLAYEVSEKPEWISLTLTNSNMLRQTRTIVLNDSILDVQFFPESGKLVHGFRNKIGFKAVGLDGKGRKIYGDVFNEKGIKVTDFTSNHLGMGYFSVIPDSSSTYHAKVSLSEKEFSSFRVSLPNVVASGSVLSAVKVKDKLRLYVASNELKGHVYIKASCRGTDYYMVEGPLREGYLVSELPSANLPEGIIVLTLLDNDKKPIAERLYFNESERHKLDVLLATDKPFYSTREETKLSIQVMDKDSIPKNVGMSVKVIKKEPWHKEANGNIRSYFLLSSELRGVVEEPGYYFDEENLSRSIDLDALLLTQGWRNYKYPVKRQGRSFFWPQPGLTIKGNVRPNPNNGKNIRDVNITMVVFGEETSFYSQQTDSLGKFNFLLKDSYGQKTKIFLNAKNSEGKKTNYRLLLDSIRAPKVVYEVKPFLQKMDTVKSAVIEAKEKRDQIRTLFDSLQGVTQLEEVVIEGRRLLPERKKAYRQFGEPDVVIKGESIREKERKWSYGLYSILLFNYGDQVHIERFSDGFMLAHIKGGRGEPTLLVVDGKLLTKEEYEFVPHMPSGIVEDVELIKYANFFKKQYLTVFPETDPLEAPSLGHIISIYTKGRVGIHGTGRTTPGSLQTTIDLFAPTKEFYSPKYDQTIPNEKPDLRSLIHWAPILSIDKSAASAISFYNGDITGDYKIIVETISEDGRIGYQEKNYSVGEEHP